MSTHKQTQTWSLSRGCRAITVVFVFLVWCSGFGIRDGELQAIALASARQTATPEAREQPCAAARLRVQDLQEADTSWDRGIQSDREIAREWRSDAVLVRARVTCAFLEPAVAVRTVFYSREARAFIEPETRRIRPFDPGLPDPAEVPDQAVDLTMLEEALLDEGYSVNSEMGPNGIEVRINTESAPFGPRDVPDGAILLHVTMGDGRDATDFFVDALLGTVYRYEDT